jgi:hypothetical protein
VSRWLGRREIMVTRTALKVAIALAGMGLATGLAAPAEARTFVAVGIGAPLYYPDPYYYYPPPVVYAPPPTYYVAPPPTYVAPQAQTWYYCDNPQGYYPYVANCATGWRQVPAAPPQGAPR